MATSMRNGKTWESSSRMNKFSSFCICSFNLRGLSKNDPKLQMEKLITANKVHDIIVKLDTHLNEEKVDMMVKNNKLMF